MNNKTINSNIYLIAQTAYIALLFYFAVVLAQFVLWLFSSLDVYVEKFSTMQFSSSAKYIINRHPFDIVREQPKPIITDQITLTGIYAARKNSIAFYEIKGKSFIAKIGDKIGNIGLLKEINLNSVTIGNAIVNITKGTKISNEIDNTTTNNVKPQDTYSPPIDSNDLKDPNKREQLIQDYTKKFLNKKNSND